MFDVSIVIVNWNTRQLLIDCIDSIKNETTEVTYEIIVVDNGSTDDSVEVLKMTYSDVKIIENARNEGFAKANNIGIKQSTGRYVLLSNTDIVVLDKAVDKLVIFMDNNENIGCLLPKCIDAENRLRQCCRDLPTLRNLLCEAFFLDRIFPKVSFFRGRSLPKSFYNQNGNAESMPCCFMIVSKKAIEEVGLLDERFFFYGEDLDWCKRFIQKGWDTQYLADSKVIHFGGASAKTRPLKYYKEHNKAMLKYWLKHYGLSGLNTCIAIYVAHHFVRLNIYLVVGVLNLCRCHYDLAGVKRNFNMLTWLCFESRKEVI